MGECMGNNNQHQTIVEGTYLCNTTQIVIFGGNVKVRESLYTQVLTWVNTILKHIETRAIIPRYEGSYMVYRHEWSQQHKYSEIPIPYLYRNYSVFS